MLADPIDYQDGMNWYNYVGSDPVNGTCPSGLGADRNQHAIKPIDPHIISVIGRRWEAFQTQISFNQEIRIADLFKGVPAGFDLSECGVDANDIIVTASLASSIERRTPSDVTHQKIANLSI